jgi:hypothetical protein
LFQFVPLLITHRQVELRFVLFGFCHWQFFTSIAESRRLKAIILYAEPQIPYPSANDDGRAALGKVISKIFRNLESPIP